MFSSMKRTKKTPALREQIVLRIDRRLRKAIEAAAEQDHRTVSDYVRIILVDHVSIQSGAGAQAA
jgi:uncharacterized protein (DUF1778 family)